MVEKLTYRQLAAEIAKFSPEQLDMDVTVHIRSVDEFMPAELAVCEDNGILDEWHPVIAVED